MRLTHQNKEAGAILITVMVMMVVLSLGVGAGLMLNSSSVETTENNIELRAVNVAEAGYRYAGGEYISAGGFDEKLDRLEAMNQEKVILLNNNGSFQLSIYPYFFVANSDGEFTTLSMRVPGKFPDGFENVLPATGTVYINGKFYEYGSGTPDAKASAMDSDEFSITLTGSETVDVDSHTCVYLAFSPPNGTMVEEGKDFSISVDASLEALLPERNGFIDLYKDEDTHAGSYRYRQRTRDANNRIVLSDIQPVEDDSLPLNLDSGSRVVMKKQVRIESVGAAGSGNMEASRELDLNVYLTDEMYVPPDTAKTLDLGGTGGADTFDDEEGTGANKKTVLKNWEFNNSDGTPERDLYVSTTQEVQTEYTDEPTSSVLTFQNFSEEDQDAGYTMEVIDKERIPEAVRDKDLYGIWGNASDNMYFVGQDGTVLHFDGTDITLDNDAVSTSSGKTLYAIWGLPDQKDDASETDKIFIGGADGKVMINEGNGWISGRNSKTYDVYAANGTAWNHFDGYGEAGTNPYHWSNNWSSTYQFSHYNAYVSQFSGKANFRCLWAIHETYGGRTDQNVMVGEFSGDGSGFKNGDGIIMHEFYKYVVISGIPLRGIWGSEWANQYVVGDNGAIFQNTQGHTNWQNGWIQISSSLIPTTENLNGIYGNSATDFYVVGDNGTILYNKGEGFEIVDDPDDEVSENLNSIWGSDLTGIYAVGDNGTIVFLGYPKNTIGEYILPLSRNSDISAKWESANHYLSYTIQVKQIWGDELNYAAAGICFRWHEEQAGKYAGYGISFMRYDPSSNSVNDMIPDSIKPYFKGTGEVNNRLLVVLWEQYVQGGAENRRWVAYKDISLDSAMVKTNGTPVDLSSLFVRVHEKSIDGRKVNDITVYYANPLVSFDPRRAAADNLYNNTIRYPYNATFGTNSSELKWPVFDIDEWSGCSGRIDCQGVDKFTLVDNVSVAQTPVEGTYWIVNPATDCTRQSDGYTLRTGRFTSPSGEDFGTQSERSEIAVFVMGDIGDNGSQTLLSLADFGLQLGVESEGDSTDSSFGGLQ